MTDPIRTALEAPRKPPMDDDCPDWCSRWPGCGHSVEDFAGAAPVAPSPEPERPEWLVSKHEYHRERTDFDFWCVASCHDRGDCDGECDPECADCPVPCPLCPATAADPEPDPTAPIAVPTVVQHGSGDHVLVGCLACYNDGDGSSCVAPEADPKEPGLCRWCSHTVEAVPNA